MWIDDQVLAGCHEDVSISAWVPQTPMVVLGRSNKASREVNTGACERDNISILKRLGGGGTVLLHKGCLVVSVGAWVRDYYQNDLYFRLLNQSVIQSLRHRLPNHEFGQRGHSDIVFGERKVAGTSLFRSRNYLLYQASILIDLQIDKIEQYLAHPSLEPDYRKGRSHRDFLLGLSEIIAMSPQDWEQHFTAVFGSDLKSTMSSELLSAQAHQIDHVKSRIGEIHPIE